MIKSRLRRLLIRLPLILFGLLVGAAFSEIALRLAGYSFPEFYQLDSSRGYSLRPSMEGWYRKEGEAYVRLNSEGLRDREHAKPKSADTFRIAVLGDSYAEALQVSQEQAFWSVMENQLKACESLVPSANTVGTPLRGRPELGAAQTVGDAGNESGGARGVAPLHSSGKIIEVINFGVSGYSTAQQLITLREHVWAYSPDLVLLAVTTNNDISDNSRALKKTDEVPYFVLRDHQLILDDSFKASNTFRLRQSFINRVGRWFKDHSRLVQAVNEGHRGLKVWLASLKASWRKSETPAAEQTVSPDTALRSEELGIDNLVYVEPANSVWIEAWLVTESLIKELRDEVRSRGARFVMITLSNPPQVAPNAELRQKFLQRVRANDIFYPDNRFRQLGAREGIEVITLAPELQAYADTKKVFLHGFGSNLGNGHWNIEGHRVAGELIARKLCGGLVADGQR